MGISSVFCLFALATVTTSVTVILTCFSVSITSCSFLSWVLACIALRNTRSMQQEVEPPGQVNSVGVTSRRLALSFGIVMSLILLCMNPLTNGAGAPTFRPLKEVAASVAIPVLAACVVRSLVRKAIFEVIIRARFQDREFWSDQPSLQLQSSTRGPSDPLRALTWRRLLSHRVENKHISINDCSMNYGRVCRGR